MRAHYDGMNIQIKVAKAMAQTGPGFDALVKTVQVLLAPVVNFANGELRQAPESTPNSSGRAALKIDRIVTNRKHHCRLL